MKKVVALTSVLVLAACGNDVAKHDADFAGCERIETTEFHLVYKCPADQEWVQQVKQMQPNGKFKAGGYLNLEELYADTANVYVEVALNNKDVCKEDFTVRTMIAKPVQGGGDWAFIGCK